MSETPLTETQSRTAAYVKCALDKVVPEQRATNGIDAEHVARRLPALTTQDLDDLAAFLRATHGIANVQACYVADKLLYQAFGERGSFHEEENWDDRLTRQSECGSAVEESFVGSASTSRNKWSGEPLHPRYEAALLALAIAN